MTRIPALAAALCLLCWSATAAADVSMDWRQSESTGQCDAGRPINPRIPSQFVVGRTKDGTHLTVQFIGWRLPVNDTNMMKVKLQFDDGQPIATEALVIARIAAFQLFVRFMPVTEGEFWKQLLGARRLVITGPFEPGRAEIDLGGIAGALPLLRGCAARQLPGQALPFDAPSP